MTGIRSRSSINFAFRASRLSIFNFIEEWYIPSAIAFTVESIWRSTFPSSDRHPSTVARPSTRRRFISRVNSSQNSLNRVGIHQPVLQRMEDRGASWPRRMFKRFVQVPLLRAVAQPSRSLEIIV